MLSLITLRKLGENIENIDHDRDSIFIAVEFDGVISHFRTKNGTKNAIKLVSSFKGKI